MKRSDFLKLEASWVEALSVASDWGFLHVSSAYNGDSLDWTSVTGSMTDHAAPAIQKCALR